DRAQFGYPDADLRALRFTPAFAGLLKLEVERARALFAEGQNLVRRVPPELAVDVDLFSRGGRAVLDAIEARGYDVLSARPALSRWTKLRLLGQAMAAIALARMRRRGSRPLAHAGHGPSERDANRARGAPQTVAARPSGGENAP